jgi:prophage regulatory protein
MRHVEIGSLSTVSEGQAAEFLRMPSVVRRTGLARSTIYRLIAERKFPSPVKLAGRAVGWRRSDLDRWSEARPSAAH